MKLKREVVLNLHNVLQKFLEDNKENNINKRLSFAIFETLENISPKMKAITEANKPTDQYIEYQNKQQEIGKKYSDRDDFGNPILENRNGFDVYVIAESNKKLATDELIVLNESYSETIQRRKEELLELQAIMEEEVDVDICKVSFKYFPEEYNLLEQGILKLLISESKEEIKNMLLG